jgi:hypothetical protein
VFFFSRYSWRYNLVTSITKIIASSLRFSFHLYYSTDSLNSINQRDLEECGCQVLRMKDIHTWADRVIVWLGPEMKKSKLAISFITYIGSQVIANRYNGLGPAPGCTNARLWRGEWGNLGWQHNTEALQAVLALLDLPWFDRVW